MTLNIYICINYIRHSVLYTECVLSCTSPHTKKNLYSSHPSFLFVEIILLKDFIIFYIMIYYDNVVVKIVDIDIGKIVGWRCRSSQLVHAVRCTRWSLYYICMKFILFQMLTFICSVLETLFVVVYFLAYVKINK